MSKPSLEKKLGKVTYNEQEIELSGGSEDLTAELDTQDGLLINLETEINGLPETVDEADTRFTDLMNGTLTRIEKEFWVGVITPKIYACSNLTNLEYLYIPASLMLSASVPLGLAYACQQLKTVIIEEGVTAIPTACFNLCRAIEYIELPSTITVLGQRSLLFTTSSAQPFNGRIRIKAQTPPTLQGAYGSGSSSQAGLPYYGSYTIEVPLGTLSVYKSATNWSTYDVDNGGPATFVEYEEVVNE